MDSTNFQHIGVTIKTEPGTSESSTSNRLPSLKPPRDFSLSAFGQKLPPNLINNKSKNKKVYIPNLNVQRNKNSEQLINNDIPKNKSKEKASNVEVKERGRGRKSNLIQTGSGLFAEGMAKNARTAISRSGGGGEKESLQKPKLKLQDNVKINKEEEEATMKVLLRDDFIDDPNLEPDYNHCPVKLPLVDWKLFSTEDETKMKIKDEDTDGIKVKTEPGLMPDFKGETKKPLSLPDFVKTSASNPQYLFLQLPNCLPGLKPEVDQPRHGQKVESGPSTSTTTINDTEIKPEEKRCTLNTLAPGCIGKLQILKSGQARLVLGDIKLTVQLGTQVAFKENLISLNLEKNTHSGDMVNMGPLVTRFVVSPDWEDMLMTQMQI
uniref:DNA-directed RNA polymerase III subunit RPC4 n=1 Tax=Clastoptera arizonana TaxID=38151 RepID=A0A1B6CWU7_9HEMI